MKRDLRIDSIRGLLLVVMTIDHFDGWLAQFTHETLGFVSALEGFIFLSGYVFALLYANYADRPRLLLRKAAARSFLIYRYQLLLLLCIPLALLWSGGHSKFVSDWVNPLLSAPFYYFVQAGLLLNEPVFLDILPIYCVLVLISPLLLLACRHGAAELVLLIAVLGWLLAPHFNPLRELADVACVGCRYGFLNLLAWQLIWCAGVYFGYRRYAGLSNSWLLRPGLLQWAGMLALVCFLIRHQNVQVVMDVATDRVNLGWLRITNFALLALLVSAIVARLPSHRGLPWFAFLGQYSLQVFAFHVFLCFAILPYRQLILNLFGELGFTLVTLFVIASLTLPAWAYRRYQQGRKLRRLSVTGPMR